MPLSILWFGPRQHARIVEQLEPRFPPAARMRRECAEGLLALMNYPKDAWKAGLEQRPAGALQSRAPRRTEVAGIFPNRAAIIRLAGAVRCETSEE